MIFPINNRILHQDITHAMQPVFFASLFNAKVLLGRATPSLESYYNSITGKYGLVELNERYGEIELPKIEIVDTKKH
jgi:primosomal protein N' (replication factor Y)